MKRTAVKALAAFLAIFAAGAAGLPTLEGVRVDADVGGASDFNATFGSPLVCNLSMASGAASEPLYDAAAGTTYRTLTENARMVLSCAVDAYDLSATGVPYVGAVLRVRYRDDIDENECSTAYYSCRDKVQLRTDRYAAGEWYSVGGIGGAADGAWKNLSLAIGATPYQLLRVVDGAFSVAVYNARQPSGAVPLAIDRISLEFLPQADFEAFRETLRAENGLIRSDYLNNTLPAPPARPAAGQPFAIFARNTLERIWANTVPTAEEVSASCTVAATEIRGETEAATFSVFAWDALSALTVSVSNLDASVASIELFEVLQEDRRWVFSMDKYYGSNPWSLRPLAFPLNASMKALGNWDRAWPSEITVPASTTRQFWMSIHVSKTAPVGTHSGTITVCATASGAQQSCRTATLSLTVFDLELGLSDAETWVYHSPFLKNSWGPDRTYVVADQAAHGPLAPIVYARGTILSNGTVDFSKMEPEMEALQSAGILQIAGRVRLLNSDNWRSLWTWTYGGTDYCNRNDTTEFDDKMRSVLQQYSEFVARYGATVDNSFIDEPGTDVDDRRISNHLNRLAKEVGQSTWVTWYVNCEQPLAGHDFVFSSSSSELPENKMVLPYWVKTDSELRVLYDFDHVEGPLNVTDLSGRGNYGRLYKAEIVNGVLETNASTYLIAADDDSLDLPDALTFMMNIRVDALTDSYANRFCTKWHGTSDANWCAYLFGESGNGSMGAYLTLEDGTLWRGSPGQDFSLLMPAKSKWHSVLWTYDSNTGGRLYLDYLLGASSTKGKLVTNDASMVLGSFQGGIDDFALLGRALTEAEQAALTQPPASFFKTATLTLTVPAGTSISTTLNFVFTDFDLDSLAAFGASKRLLVNGVEVWAKAGQTLQSEFFSVSLGSAWSTASENKVVFEITNGRSSADSLRLYIENDDWRNLNTWEVGGTGLGSVWTHAYTYDKHGDLGPMRRWLDDAVAAMRYVKKDVYQQIRDLGMEASYYTTYFANAPFPVWNRMLNGIYASAINAKTINVYAYGDWAADPWDEQFGRPSESLTGYRKFQSSYGLVQPSWDPMVYDCVVWETLREGIEDSRIIRLLKTTIAKNPASSWSQRAQAFLDDLFSRPDRDFGSVYFKTRSSGPIEYRGDTSDLLLADIAGNPADFAFFDRTRRQMIDMLLEEAHSSSGDDIAAATLPQSFSAAAIAAIAIIVAAM